MSPLPEVAPEGKVFALVRVINVGSKQLCELLPGERWHSLLRTARVRARQFPPRLDVRIALITPPPVHEEVH